MFDLASIVEFSHQYCIGICAVLVPLNLLATLQTLILTGLDKSFVSIRWVSSIAIFLALLLVFHVWTWFLIGVVMTPTYILLFLGSVCLIINTWAIAHSESMKRILHQGVLIVVGNRA
jgi:hypothetical protein